MPSLSTLDQRFKPFAQGLYKQAHQADPRFTVTSARRSHGEQQRLYANYLKGLSDLPALPPGSSMHERGLAIDLARLGIDPKDDDLLAQFGQAWRTAGGVWGGEVDPVHFEAPTWMTGRSYGGKSRRARARRPRRRRRRA